MGWMDGRGRGGLEFLGKLLYIYSIGWMDWVDAWVMGSFQFTITARIRWGG